MIPNRNLYEKFQSLGLYVKRTSANNKSAVISHRIDQTLIHTSALAVSMSRSALLPRLWRDAGPGDSFGLYDAMKVLSVSCQKLLETYDTCHHI